MNTINKKRTAIDIIFPHLDMNNDDEVYGDSLYLHGQKYNKCVLFLLFAFTAYSPLTFIALTNFHR